MLSQFRPAACQRLSALHLQGSSRGPAVFLQRAWCYSRVDWSVGSLDLNLWGRSVVKAFISPPTSAVGGRWFSSYSPSSSSFPHSYSTSKGAIDCGHCRRSTHPTHQAQSSIYTPSVRAGIYRNRIHTDISLRKLSTMSQAPQYERRHKVCVIGSGNW